MRAVFFDLDDTLCDTNSSRQARAELVAKRLVADYGKLKPDDLIERILEVDNPYGWPRGVSPLLQELDLVDSDAGKEAVGLWFFDGCSDLLTIWPGEANALRSLSRDYTLGVITNGDDAIQRRKFGYLGFDDYFRVFVSSERAGCYKPDAAIFQSRWKKPESRHAMRHSWATR